MQEESPPAQHISSVINCWQLQGHDIELLHPGNTLGKQYKEEGDKKGLPLIWERVQKDWNFSQYLANAIQQHKPEVVYHRYANSTIFPILRCKLTSVPLVLEINADLDVDLSGYWGNSRLMRGMIKLLASLQYLLADHIIVVSEGIGDKLRRKPLINNQKISVVPNGADLEVFRPLNKLDCRRELALDEEGDYLIFSGKFQLYQGVQTILQVAQQLRNTNPSLKIILVGDGPEEENLRESVEHLNISSEIIFTGWCPPEITAKYIGASDICLAPYTSDVLLNPTEKITLGASMKGSPLKIFTYLASGRPVIASHFAEAGQFVKENQVGFDVEPENPTILADKISTLLLDKEYLEEMGIRARAHA